MNRHALCVFIASTALVLSGAARAAEPSAMTPDEQVARVKQLRKEKKYADALKLLDEMIGPITPSNPIPKIRGWAFDNVEVRKEKAMIMEELAVIVPKIVPFGLLSQKLRIHLWGNAVQEWVAIIRAIAPTATKPHHCELFVEQKRCTLLAYSALGTVATRGNKPDLDAKFRQLKEDFQGVIRAPNAPPNAKNRALAILTEHKNALDPDWLD